MNKNNKMEIILKVKAHMDMLGESSELYGHIIDAIPNKYDDDVFEFEIVIRKIKDLTEEVGVDEEGCRAFCDVEVKVEAK